MALLALTERVSRRLLSLQGVESRTARTTVGRVHWYDAPGAGALPTIVLLHGLAASATQYGQLIRMLRPYVRRVIAPDAPGHGFNAASEEITPETLFTGILEVLDVALDDRAVVFGNSLGGALAIRYGLQRPGRTLGLFLSSPGGAAMSERELESFMRTFEIRSAEQAADFLPRLYSQRPWFTPLVAHDLIELFSRPSIRALIEAIGPEHLFKPEELQSLSMPIRLVWGQADRLMPRGNLEFFRKSLPPHAVIEEPEEFGHSPFLDRTAAVAQLLISFARSLERAETNGRGKS